MNKPNKQQVCKVTVKIVRNEIMKQLLSWAACWIKTHKLKLKLKLKLNMLIVQQTII